MEACSTTHPFFRASGETLVGWTSRKRQASNRYFRFLSRVHQLLERMSLSKIDALKLEDLFASCGAGDVLKASPRGLLPLVRNSRRWHRNLGHRHSDVSTMALVDCWAGPMSDLWRSRTIDPLSHRYFPTLTVPSRLQVGQVCGDA